MLQRSSIFRERRNQYSLCFEIWELFGANLSILLELITNSTPVCIWTLARSLKWHFGMAPVDSLQQLIPVAAINHADPLALQAPSLHYLSSEALLACWQGKTNARRKEACINSSQLCLVLCKVSKDLPTVHRLIQSWALSQAQPLKTASENLPSGAFSSCAEGLLWRGVLLPSIHRIWLCFIAHLLLQACIMI